MGRSGVALAQAATRHGAQALVLDEQPAETPERIAVVERLQGMGAEVTPGWHGRLVGETYDLLVASPGFRREHPAIRDALAAGKEVISEVEFAYRIARNPIIAITGTNGKSTTTVLTWMLLQAGLGERRALLCGNISGSGFPELTLTEAAMAAESSDVLVAEVSSYQLEWVSSFRPRAAAITNITPDHLDRHPSFEDYFATKLRIFGAMGEGDVAVMNESEPSIPVARLLEALPLGVGVRTFALSRPSGASGPTTFRDGDHVYFGGRRVDLAQLPLFGDHNVTNALMAYELATASGASDFERMMAALVDFRGLEHRMERIGSRHGILVVNNSMCTNPMAVIASCRALPMRQHLLLGGLTKNLDFSPVRRFLEDSDHVAYVFGGSESDALAEQIGSLAKRMPDLSAAFAAAVASARSGEAIVLSPGCLSAGPYENFRQRGEDFKRMAKEWLRS
jgi:UDP-N-acetylmuramoylalanine--D-glutamate ligase